MSELQTWCAEHVDDEPHWFRDAACDPELEAEASEDVASDPSRAEQSQTCALFNFTDLPLACGAHGDRSSCVAVPGWGMMYFTEYSVGCAGSSKQLCFTSRGPCT